MCYSQGLRPPSCFLLEPEDGLPGPRSSTFSGSFLWGVCYPPPAPGPNLNSCNLSSWQSPQPGSACPSVLPPICAGQPGPRCHETKAEWAGRHLRCSARPRVPPVGVYLCSVGLRCASVWVGPQLEKLPYFLLIWGKKANWLWGGSSPPVG